MPLIAIFTEKKDLEEIILKNIEYDIIVINKGNIENFKNVAFDTIIIPEKVKCKEELIKLIVSNAKYIIMNCDIEENNKYIENKKLKIITYGFNCKSTVTASSVEDEEVMICIQRSIKKFNNEVIYPQEIKTKLFLNIYSTMCIVILNIIYNNYE